MIVFAHAGHLFLDLLYLAPLLLLVVAVGVGRLRDRRERRPDDGFDGDEGRGTGPA